MKSTKFCIQPPHQTVTFKAFWRGLDSVKPKIQETKECPPPIMIAVGDLGTNGQDCYQHEKEITIDED